MKDINHVRSNRESHAPRRGPAIRDCFWLLALSSVSQLMAVGCGNNDEKQVTGSSAANQGQGGGAGTAAGLGGASESPVGGNSGGAGVTANATGAGGSEAAGAKGGKGGNIGGAGGEETSGKGGTSGAAGASGSGGQGGSSGTAARRPPCLTKGSQVVLIGDSYVSWITHTFPEDMNKVVGQPVRNYAVGGYSLGSGGIGQILPELDQAIAEDPDIIAVVMDGGGNDFLVPDIFQFPRGGECKNDPNSASIPDCQAIVKLAIDSAVDCMDNLVTAGIQDVVYFFYPHVPEGTWLAESPNGILEYALPKAKEACDTAFTRTQGKLNCYFVDMTPVFEGHPEYFAEGDLHENSEGSAAMAKKIWQVLVDHCVAQPESSGCCTP